MIGAGALAWRGDPLGGLAQLAAWPRLEALRARNCERRPFSVDSPLSLPRSAGCRGLADRGTYDWELEDVSAELRPRVRSGTSADQRHLRRGDSGAAQRFHRVREPERHAFDDRSDDRVAPVIRTQPGENPGRLRSVRRALPG